ncbi:class I SAM-dependent methyltransferase [Verrucomicrobiales bacterium]|nr:class I SAM-dependent methyltransferase [Verrucomicrobiales bacterium]
MTDTIQFYDEHAAGYFDQTVGIDMSELRRRFLDRLPDGAMILDAGCGSGRDARAFLDAGYEVVAIDASRGMAEQARERLAVEVEVMRFEEMSFREEFDGVWACASLLHIPTRDLPGVLEKMEMALKPGGTLYLSFKRGEREEDRMGRRFQDMTRQGLIELLGGFDRMNLVEIWEGKDARNDPSEDHPTWVNGLFSRS